MLLIHVFHNYFETKVVSTLSEKEGHSRELLDHNDQKNNKWVKQGFFFFFFFFALLLFFAEGVKNQDTTTCFYSKSTILLLYKIQ
jgi:hypothetical protein